VVVGRWRWLLYHQRPIRALSLRIMSEQDRLSLATVQPVGPARVSDRPRTLAHG